MHYPERVTALVRTHLRVGRLVGVDGMAHRISPSWRQLRLGAELQKLRNAKGATGAEAASHAGLSGAHLGHIEAGRTAIVESRLRALMCFYGVENDPLFDALIAMNNATGKGWWSAYRRSLGQRLCDLAEVESTAVGCRTFEVMHVPGLLQTPEFMRALFRSGNPDASTADVERSVDFRLQRQEVLPGLDPLGVHAVIHEAAFLARFVPRDVMRQQLEHLLCLAEQPNVRIQLLPFRAEDCPSMPGGPFTIYETAVPRLGTCYVEHPVGATFLGDEESLTGLSTAFQRLSTVALAPLEPGGPGGPSSSLGLVQHLLYAL
jgi:transcriptional regulator with XRE-family HTH domain